MAAPPSAIRFQRSCPRTAMLTTEGCAQRRGRLWDRLDGACEALILGDPQSLIYFANYAPSPFVFRSCDAAAVLVLEQDRAALVADSMVKAYLAQAHVDEVVAPVWYDGKHSAPHRQALRAQTAHGLLAKLKPARLGVERASVVDGVLGDRADSAVALDDIVRGLRRVKDAHELALR